MRGNVLVLLMGTACLAAGGAEPARGTDLLPSGGFETDADGDGIPDGWRLAVDPADRHLTGRLSPEAHSGRHGFCVANGTGSRGSTLTSPAFDLKPDTAYEVSAWLRMDARFPQDTALLRVSAGGRSYSFDLTITRQWRRRAIRFVTEPGTTSGTLQFSQLGGQAERLYLDDVAVREVDAKDAVPRIPRTDLTGFEFPRHRPRVQHTAEEVEAIRRAMTGRDLRQHARVTAGDRWLEKRLHFFEEGYDFRKHFATGRNCSDDGTVLKPVVHPDGTCEMRCPKCERVFREEAHRATARALFNREMAVGAASLGRAYALTGDPRYAVRAREILVGLADRYRVLKPGMHLVFTHLTEAHTFLLSCAQAYDYICESPAFPEEDRRKVEEDLLRAGAEYFCHHSQTNGARNNRGAIHNKAVMAIGVALGDKRFVDHALNNHLSGFHALVGCLFLPDGLSWEGFGYHFYTLSGLLPIAEMAHRVGINVYEDPAWRRVFEAPLKALAPGEEFPRVDLETASRRFAELGRPLAFPSGKSDTPAAIASHNFDHFGLAVLRRGAGPDEIYLSMECGKEAMFMGHAPGVKFSLGLHANGRMLTPRGAATYGSALCGGWARRSLAHNAITVDDRDQWGRVAAGPDLNYVPHRLTAFAAAPGVQVVRARDDDAYGDVTLDRTLFLADGYVVDLSAARAAAGEHRFDLCYRSYGSLACGLPFQPRGGPLGAGHGYQYLTDARSARTAADWSADWRQDEGSALRLSVVGGPETEVIACASPDNTSEERRVDAVVARRWGEGTVFAAVWEPYRDRPSVTSARRLPVAQRDAEGVGVEVAKEGQPGAAVFLAAYRPGKRRYGDIELDGMVAAGRWRSPEAAPDYAHLVKGVLLRRGSHSLEATAPATLYVEQIAPDRLLVRTGSESAGTLTITGRLAPRAGVERGGERLAAKPERGQSLTFAAAADTSYEVTGVADWRRIRLECEGRAEEPVQPEAAPVAETSVREPAAEAPLAGRNKLRNAGFEINEQTHPGAANPWEARSSYHLVKFRADHEYDAAVVHSGGRSLKIPGLTWANEATRDGWIEQRVPGVGAGKTYTLSAWVKASQDPTRARLVIYGWNPKWGNDYEGGVSPMFDVGTEWQRVAWTRAFGPGITDVRVMVKREHQVIGGDVWIDDIQLEEGPTATDFAPDAWSESVLPP
ncbi:MAG: alginate lyase family protein [Armatimonadetes bacterium]|nr:alginate lyase family protein [Armatimonadota bacterium]